MLITYTEANPHSLGLEAGEGSAKLAQRLIAKPGAVHQLSLAYTMSLPADANTVRTVLNAGSEQQRTIVPEQVLRVVDE